MKKRMILISVMVDMLCITMTASVWNDIFKNFSVLPNPVFMVFLGITLILFCATGVSGTYDLIRLRKIYTTSREVWEDIECEIVTEDLEEIEPEVVEGDINDSKN